jgi:hypothetical protein
MSTFYRPYLQPLSGLGQAGRTLNAVILGGPRAGAGSAIRIYNFYHGLSEPIKSRYARNLKNNVIALNTKNHANFSMFYL